MLYELIRNMAMQHSPTAHPHGGHVYVRVELDDEHTLLVWQQGDWWYWERHGPTPAQDNLGWATIHHAIEHGRGSFERRTCTPG